MHLYFGSLSKSISRKISPNSLKRKKAGFKIFLLWARFKGDSAAPMFYQF